MPDWEAAIKGDAPPPAGASVDWEAALKAGDGSSLTADRSGKQISSIGGVVDDAKYALPNLTNVRASLAIDAKTQIKRYAHATGIPEDRFGVVNGEIVYVPPGENFYAKAVPTIRAGNGVLDTADRVLAQTSAGFGPALPGIAGMVTGTVMGPTGASIPAAGGAAAVTDLARTTADKVLAGESPIPSGADLANAAGHGVVNAAGQGIAVGGARLLTRNPLGVESYDRVAAMDPQAQAERAALQAEAQKRGVDLSTGQSTGLRSIMANERQLGRFPETADQVADFSRTQRTEQVPNAFKGELDTIAPAAGREDQISGFREGAETVVQDALKQRSEQAKIAYRQAFEGRGRFWNEDVEELMKRPSVQRGIAWARKIAAEEGNDITVPVFDKGKIVGRDVVPDWRSWDYIKQGIDKVIAEHTDDFGKVDAYGRAAIQTKRALLGNLDKANPDYAIARALYGSDSEAVSSVLDGGVGFLQNMKGLDRQQIVDRVFSGGNILPAEVGRMRGLFAKAGKLDDWNAGLRGFLEGRLDNAMKATVTGGEPGNVPGKLFADLWGDPKQKAALSAALGDRAKVDSFEGLMRVLRAASRVLPEGSPTATDLGQGVSKSIGARIVAKAFSPLSYANVGNEILEIGTALRTPAARIKLADYLLSDKGAAELQKFRMLPPLAQKSMTALVDLATNAGAIGTLNAAGVRQPSDFDAPAMKRLRQEQGR